MSIPLGVIPVALLLWLAWRRPMVRISGYTEAVRSGAARRLFGSPGLRVAEVHLTEIIEIGDDLLIVYRRDAHVAGGQKSEDVAASGREAGPEEGQMFLPGIVRDAKGMLLVQRWYADRTPLASYESADRTLLGLLDERGASALVCSSSPID